MLILSQNKEKLYVLENFQGIEYGTTQSHKFRKGGEKPEDISCIFLSDGCVEELARYETKERCLEVIKDVCRAYEDSCRTVVNFDHAAMVERPYLILRNTVYEMPEV